MGDIWGTTSLFCGYPPVLSCQARQQQQELKGDNRLVEKQQDDKEKVRELYEQKLK